MFPIVTLKIRIDCRLLWNIWAISSSKHKTPQLLVFIIRYIIGTRVIKTYIPTLQPITLCLNFRVLASYHSWEFNNLIHFQTPNNFQNFVTLWTSYFVFQTLIKKNSAYAFWIFWNCYKTTEILTNKQNCFSSVHILFSEKLWWMISWKKLLIYCLVFLVSRRLKRKT